MNQGYGQDFFTAAINYCDLVDSLDRLDERSLDHLLASLLKLYLAALKLPEIEVDLAEGTLPEIALPNINFGNWDSYWEVFDPYQLDEPVGATLSDDISGIYHDLKEGISLFAQEKSKEAIWHWKFHFEAHWGSHLVDALRALHSVKANMAKARWAL